MRAGKPVVNRESRRAALRWLSCAILFGVGGSVSGCAYWRGDTDSDEARLQKLMKVPEPPSMIRQAAYTASLQYLKVQSYGIVSNLPGTGGIEPPSMERDLLLRELQTRDVENPNQFIDSPNTAIVLVETVLPPGHRAGDPLDLVVRTPLRTELNNERCSSLNNGWLMPTRLAFTQVMNDGKPRSSDVLATGTGSIIIRQTHEATADVQAKLQGRILGGGRVQKDGRLDLRIRSDYRHVAIAQRLADVINRRFYYFDGTTRKGIANPREDDLIELEVSERYRQNVHRMMAVVLAMGTEGDLGKTQERLEPLGRMLMEPTTAQDAALQLEGIGQEGIPVLTSALGVSNPEIRFYASEALAYLDHPEAIAPLVELARDQPAFRYQALLALAGMPQQQAVDGLRSLFDESSVETRCGAFDAIRRRPDRSKIIRGTRVTAGMTEIANYYDIPCKASPLVSVSLRRNPDIVVFGGPVSVTLTQPVLADGGVVLIGTDNGKIQVNRVVPGKPDSPQVEVAGSIRGLVEGIARVGGTYGDMVECLRLLNEQQALDAQLAIDILPEPLREYYRDDESDKPTVGSGVLPPQEVDPPAADEGQWYDPRSWFGTVGVRSDERLS